MSGETYRGLDLVSATDLRDDLSDHLHRCKYQGAEFCVTLRGKPFARLGPPPPALPSKSVHGACEDGGQTVRECLPSGDDPEIDAWLKSRLDAGEEKYGQPLRVGWSDAQQALREELADAINYAVSMELPDLAEDLMTLLRKVWA